MEDKLLSIISLHWNRLKYSKPSLESIIKKTTVPHELIIVDNASVEPGLVDFLKSVKGNDKTVRVEFVQNPYNMGVAGGRNEGLRVAKGNVLCVVDDDLVPPDNFDKLLIQAVNTPKVGIAGINVEPCNYQKKIINGVTLRPKYEGNIGGICQTFSRYVFDKLIGYFETFDGIYYGMEDCINSVKMKKLGLLGVYIVPRGIHLDEGADAKYRKEKTRAQSKGSYELGCFARRRAEIEKSGITYNPYKTFIPPSKDSKIKVFDNDLIMDGRK